MVGRRTLLASALALPVAARARPPVRIGVLTALSGQYQDGSGAGSVLAVRMAVADSGVAAEVVAGDMLDKPDVGAAVVRAWLDRDGVDAVVDVPNSAVALAVAGLLRAHDKVGLFSGPGLAALSGASCSPNHVQWTYDTHALASGTGRAVLAQGGRRWFFLTADYAFGHALQADTTAVVEAGGGTVVGSAAFPFPDTTDFSSYLLTAQASGADVLGLALTGAHLNNAVKQAAEFGLPARGMRMAALICLVNSIHAIGLAQAQGLLLTLPFYWDATDGTRSFARRFAAAYGGVMPSMTQAGAYSATLHYLRAVSALGTPQDGAAVVARMKAAPAQDPLFGRSVVRANGSVAHDMTLYQVKMPAEQRYPWDYLTPLQVIPAAEAFLPPERSGCGG